MSHTITLRDLEALNACPEQRELFASTFPEGVTITPDNDHAVALDAAEAGLDVNWYAYRVLTGADWDAHIATVAPAWDAYVATVARARAAYRASVAEACAAHRASVAEALCSILARRGA